MNLVSFLGWEYENGMYKSNIDEETYRVTEDRLEIYNPNLLKWEVCNMPINEYSKLQSVELVGIWTEGFAIHNEIEWLFAKNYFLQKDYQVPSSLVYSANNYLEENTVFYLFPCCGKLQIITDKQTAKKDLILKPVEVDSKCTVKYAGRAKFEYETFWQRNSNLDTTSLLNKEYTAKWHGIDVLDTLKD